MKTKLTSELIHSLKKVNLMKEEGNQNSFYVGKKYMKKYGTKLFKLCVFLSLS